MSKCACGCDTTLYLQSYNQSPHTPFEKCQNCGFAWGAKL